jgi:tol-pal system protein YbgF
MRPRVRTGSLAILVGIAPILISSCSFFRQPANAEATRTDVTEMRREQTEMMALLLELRTRIDTQDQTLSGLKADTNLALRELTDKLEALMARTEDQPAPVRRPAPAVPAPVIPGTGEPATPGTGANAGDVQASYDAAKRDFSRGNYSMAIAGFDAVLTQDPKGTLADDAQYWKGEAYYSLGEIDRAVQELLKVRDLYPDSKMICAATYKVGLAFLRKQDEPTAKRYFETVVRECPNSPEADGAQDKLKGLH